MKTFLSLLLLGYSLCAQDGASRVASEALKPSPLESNLRMLTDQIGGRVPGTPAMEKAVQWGVAGFKAAGADSVTVEQFTISNSWAEGNTRMSVTAPESFEVRAVSAAWAPTLEAKRHLPMVDVGEGKPEEFAKAGDISGALLVVHSSEMHKWEDLFAEYENAPGTIERAVKGGAIAIAFQSTRPHDLLYRHTNALAGEIDRVPMVLIAREDAARIFRLLASGEKLYADLEIPNRIGGRFESANVVAELKGSERPDEYVVLGAHLDSWELGTGALDNGCNAALVIDALRAIKASGLKPKRSIRFILFSGEEEGMIGSRAYVTTHRAEMDKIAAVLVVDSGSGRITGFATGGRKDVQAAAARLMGPVKQVDSQVRLTTGAESGTDHLDFFFEGVPTLVADQEEANYLINYHAESDTFDKVDMPQLRKHVAETAALVFALADSPARVGPRIHRAEIERDMRETHLDEDLKATGIWREWENGTRGRQD